MSTAAIPKPSEELLTPQEAAALLHVKPATLAVWRCEKRKRIFKSDSNGSYSLSYTKIGSKVFYRNSDIQRFLELSRFMSEPIDRTRSK
jgi:hypothetical protein